MYDQFIEPGTTPLFHLIGLPVYPYALLIALGTLIGIVMAGFRAKRLRVGVDTVLTYAVVGIPMALIFGRVVFCLCRIVDLLDYGVGFFLRVTSGGFSVIGAMLGLLLAAVVTHRFHKLTLLQVLDTVLPGALMVLAVARFAEGATTNGAGPEVTLAALQFVPLARQDIYGDYSYAVYLGEALTALIAAVYTQGLSTREGDATGKGMILVCAFQVLWESARRDSVLRFDFIRYSMAVAGLVLLIILILSLLRADMKVIKKIGLMLLFLLSAALCMANEFFIDGKFIQDIPIWACYAMDLAAVVAICHAELLALTAKRKEKKA